MRRVLFDHATGRGDACVRCADVGTRIDRQGLKVVFGLPSESFEPGDGRLALIEERNFERHRRAKRNPFRRPKSAGLDCDVHEPGPTRGLGQRRSVFERLGFAPSRPDVEALLDGQGLEAIEGDFAGR